MNNNPKHISFSEVRKLVNDTPNKKAKHPFLSEDLAVLNDSTLIREFVELGTPYIIEDVRMVLVEDGEIDFTINLMEKHLEKGMIFFIGYGTIIQPVRLSDNLKIRGLMMKMDLAERVMHNHFTQHHLAEDKTRFCTVKTVDFRFLQNIHEVLWQEVTNYGYREDIALPTLMLFSNFFVSLMEEDRQNQKPELSRGNKIFKRFISLVNKHCAEEHGMEFYANEMCLTAHYLGVVVKQASGVTAKEWLDRAIVTRAQVLLKSGDMQASEVSHKLSFKNPAFFNKFFKRITGMTPQEYQLS